MTNSKIYYTTLPGFQPSTTITIRLPLSLYSEIDMQPGAKIGPKIRALIEAGLIAHKKAS
jgi:hypothetical protein